MPEVTVSIGSNVATRSEELSRAFLFLRHLLEDTHETPPYVTEAEPIGPRRFPEGFTYLNAVVTGRTDLTPKALQMRMKAYERRRGRKPHPEPAQVNHSEVLQPEEMEVIIDLDLVSYDGRILKPSEAASAHFQRGLAMLSNPQGRFPGEDLHPG